MIKDQDISAVIQIVYKSYKNYRRIAVASANKMCLFSFGSMQEKRLTALGRQANLSFPIYVNYKSDRRIYDYVSSLLSDAEDVDDRSLVHSHPYLNSGRMDDGRWCASVSTVKFSCPKCNTHCPFYIFRRGINGEEEICLKCGHRDVYLDI